MKFRRIKPGLYVARRPGATAAERALARVALEIVSARVEAKR